MLTIRGTTNVDLSADDVLLRLVGGEEITALSDETGIPVIVLESWRTTHREAGLPAARECAYAFWRRGGPKASRPSRYGSFKETPSADPGDHMSVPEHLHYLWVTLGLDDE